MSSERIPYIIGTMPYISLGRDEMYLVGLQELSKYIDIGSFN